MFNEYRGGWRFAKEITDIYMRVVENNLTQQDLLSRTCPDISDRIIDIETRLMNENRSDRREIEGFMWYLATHSRAWKWQRYFNEQRIEPRNLLPGGAS